MNSIMLYSGFVDPKVGAPATTIITELYASTESLGVALTKSKEDDVSVLSAQRVYNRCVASRQNNSQI